MADLTITSANVKPLAGASIKSYTAGEAITPGHWVYKKTSDGSNKYFQADNVSTEPSQVVGMAISFAQTDGLVQIVESGQVDMGAILTKAEVYGLSANAGKTAPLGDLASGEYRTVVGYAKTTSIFVVSIVATNEAKA